MKRTILLAFFCLCFFSCEKDILEKKPIIGATEENFYKTADDAVSAVNGAYAALQFELTPAGHFRWFWGDIFSDDSTTGGSGPNDQPDLQALENFQGLTDTEYLEAEWAADYEGIYRANIVLERVPAIEMDTDLKNRVLGEAKFIRAWFFYNLVTLFGDVPLVDRVLAPSEYNIPRTPATEVWALIEQDLTEAIADLWPRSQYGVEDLGRITKGAAQGLLLKAYMYQSRFAEAEGIANDIIASGEYQLVADYSQLFTEAGENNEESVFEIQYMNASGGNWGRNNANEGTFTNVFQRARGQFEGFGFNLPTQDFVDEFFKEGFEDPRLSATVFRVGDFMGDRGQFTKEATGYPHEYYSKKNFNNKSEEAPFGDPNPNGGTNDRVIRYADVLLMHAEAAFHNGKEAEARSSLNLVRKRVNLDAITRSGQPLLESIYHERRVELGLEGHRYFDLIRTGRAPAVLGPLGFKEGVNEVLPIPESQILATNGAITQNPGY
ncbi:MAG: RagB/SusD family nutrient uptake outer membrane protein [Saprospiraceae bacterium]|nr:RagB/SusD family nutrient uptake outer membrane protein [Saprospiraceae bacterium]